MLDLPRLRALHAVSVHGTVGAAATALGYTPPPCPSRSPSWSGRPAPCCWNGRGGGVALTDEARHLAATAQELLAIVERAETELEERRGLPAGG